VTSTPRGTPPSARLDARYGRSPRGRRRRLVVGLSVAVAFVVVFAAWVVFAAFDGTSSQLESADVGYQVTSDRAVEVQYTVTADTGRAVDCAVEAQNSGFAVVGWKIVHLPASERRSVTYTTSLATSERAVTGLIYRCWLP